MLKSDGKRLEIPEEIVQRIISHLIVSKNVILVGPPGTGKTDLAYRILKELGQRILHQEDPIIAVASYEWGRYEVIGGNSLNQLSNGNYFHAGCVTKAIREDKLLLIDEFNRADMNKAFGEMFLAVEHGKIELREDEKPNGLASPIVIPTTFRMICTMNDYDKSLLNDLSYGLLRRFAIVEIDVPKDKEKLKTIGVERAAVDLHIAINEIPRDLTEENSAISKFIDFMYDIQKRRKIGVSSIIDVIRYILSGKLKQMEDNEWKLLNQSLVDYVLPQFDRLDITTLKDVKVSIERHFSGIDNAMNPELLEFYDKLSVMVEKLNEVSKLFEDQ